MAVSPSLIAFVDALTVLLAAALVVLGGLHRRYLPTPSPSNAPVDLPIPSSPPAPLQSTPSPSPDSEPYVPAPAPPDHSDINNDDINVDGDGIENSSRGGMSEGKMAGIASGVIVGVGLVWLRRFSVPEPDGGRAQVGRGSASSAPLIWISSQIFPEDFDLTTDLYRREDDERGATKERNGRKTTL
ncbi:hypothetical protein FF1_022386 [Malus domestica]